jgi:hypothetical protein
MSGTRTSPKRRARVSAGTRPNRNEIAKRVTALEGGRIQVDLGQTKQVIATYRDVLCAMPPEDVAAEVAAELRTAARRSRKPNLS